MVIEGIVGVLAKGDILQMDDSVCLLSERPMSIRRNLKTLMNLHR